MKKTFLVFAVLIMAIILGACTNDLHNAGGLSLARVEAINLPEDGDYAIIGAWALNEWNTPDPTTHAEDITTASGGAATWSFTTPREIPFGSDGFKIYSVTSLGGGADWWNHVPADNTLQDVGSGNAEVLSADGAVVDGADNWVLTWDASQSFDSVLSMEKE